MSSQLFNLSKSGQMGSPPAFQQKSPEQALVLNDPTFIKLRDLIYQLSGIYFTDGKKYLLEGRIAKRVLARNFKTFEDYVGFLESPHSKQELHYLYEAITINETYFFRAEQQFEAFEKIVVPEILHDRLSVVKSTTFRIWSAASSTGEEAYTLAMLILERLKPLYPGVQFQIVASDINRQVIETAKRGIYKEYAIRNVPPNFMNKYFKKDGSTYLVTDEVKNMVRFVQINLYDQYAMRTITNCDVIFCANVLIYFDIPSKQKVVSYLYDSLNKGGYLFIGYSESLHGVSKAFKLIHLPKAMTYKKE